MENPTIQGNPCKKRPLWAQLYHFWRKWMDGWIVFNDWHLRTAPLAVVLELEFFIWTPTKLSQKEDVCTQAAVNKSEGKVLGHFPQLVRP